jgi:predicted transcriptional regulator
MPQKSTFPTSAILEGLKYAHKLILEALLRKQKSSPQSPTLTRLELMQNTGREKGSISSNLKQLIDWGLVLEAREIRNQKGRPKSFYSITLNGMVYYNAKFSSNQIPKAIAKHILEHGSAPKRLTLKVKRRKETKNKKSPYETLILEFSHYTTSPPCLRCEHFNLCDPFTCPYLGPDFQCPECNSLLITPSETSILTCPKCGLECIIDDIVTD